ncbi:integrin alpha-E isoform X2 [Hyperolius riggenbachi]|uniref:integrin alpha-E isoform X2 n=1 Tax=Hyperolius riggenbachi TaxID=752182 RepID=UPI0035A3B3F8
MFMVPSGCFNIDTVKTWSFTASKKSLFGQSVMQFNHGSEKGVYVFSPLKDAEKRIFDGLFKCALMNTDSSLQCKMDNIPLAAGQGQGIRSVPYPVLSQHRNSDSILTCQQIKTRKKKSTTEELNGACFLQAYANGTVENRLYTDFEIINKTKEIMTKRKETLDNLNMNSNNNNNNNNNNKDEDDDEGGTEICIVLDGSGSIEEVDFMKAKNFTFNLMTKIWDKCSECEFAVVQYGEVIQTEFNIEESRKDSRSILEKVQNIKQLGNVTKTASALLHVLDTIYNENSGSKPSSTKIILVVTDGEIYKDPVNLSTVIKDTRMQSIERFSIGVGNVFNRRGAYQELKDIATDEDHIIRVDDYSKLDGLLSGLQQNIIGIEGTEGQSLGFDLAQAGFAAHVKDKDTMVLGVVGAFDWSGGLMIYPTSKDSRRGKFLNDSALAAGTAAYGYLGYSVTTAQGQHTFLYIAGAPRHSNVGKVFVFEEDITSHHYSETLKGEQLGSYFGHQLCALDVKSDGFVDFLLVGAPFYHIKGEEGRVYVYKLSVEGKFTLAQTMDQHYYPYARFGYSIAKIGDVNQDGYQDIAIGAPLEGRFEDTESFGSVYIYNSKADGIYPTPSQRIRAAEFKQKLQFFGQSVDGGLDLTEDGYPDIAVGSLGTVIVLRSRPVVEVKAYMQFTPEQIPLVYKDTTVEASLCFHIEPFNSQEFKKTNLNYNLDLDAYMEAKRIAFHDEASRNGMLYLLNVNCTKPIVLNVLPCIYDCFSDIIINVSYTLTSTDQKRDLPSPIMDFYKKNYTLSQLPYEKDCKNKTVCTPELHLTTEMSRKELIVGHTKDLTMSISLENTGDDSYMTNVTLIYPKNLQFNTIKPANNPNVKCYEFKRHHSLNSTMKCSIRHPVFKSSKEAFDIIWQLNEEMFSASEADILCMVSNMNGMSTPLHQKISLPVRHALKTVLNVQPSTLYVKIMPEPAAVQEIQYTFSVNGENQFDADLALELQIPVQIKHNTLSEISPIQTTQKSTLCTQKSQTCKCGNSSRTQNEEVLTCLVIRCNLTSLPEEFTVTAKLFLQTLQKF